MKPKLPITRPFQAVNSLRFWIPVGTLVAALAGLGFIGWKKESFHGLWPIVTILALLLVITGLNALTERITMDEKGVRFKSLFRSFYLPWSEVKSWGGYRSTRIGNRHLDLSSAWKSWGNVFLYVSTSQTFDRQRASKAHSGFLTMHYRPEFMAILEEKLGPPTSPA